MVKRVPLSAARQNELREDFRKNVPRHVRLGLREYVRWLHRHERPAERVCQAGVPTWIVHAEKGTAGSPPTSAARLKAALVRTW